MIFRTFDVDELFRRICQQIVREGLTEQQWAQVESDDMFQEGQYEGGFDADEEAFCFSRYSPDGEWWFQLTLEEVRDVAAGRRQTIESRRADSDP